MPSPASVLFAGPLPPHPGGTALSCAEILEGLASGGHAVRALVPAGPGYPPFAYQLPPTLAVRRVDTPRLENDPYTPPPAAIRAARREGILAALTAALDEARPDVLVVGHETLVHGVPALARAHGIPSVVLVRGVFNAILAGRYPEPAAAELCAELAQADLLVTVAKHMAVGARRLGLDRVTTIPNAVDATRFRPGRRSAARLARLGLPPDALVVAHVSNFKSVKRPLDLVDSAARVLAEDCRTWYLVVGDGTMRAETEARCRDRGVADRFRFVGGVPYADVPGWIRLADVVVMPSESEGIARTYLETQASGRVLLASDIPGAREVVRPGETGALFPVGDVAALAARTLELARDPGRRAAIGRAARRQTVAHHALADAVARYGDLLDELARRPRRTGRAAPQPAGRR
jgi:glycosyltransferase involved in cell wall biosynthesis